MDRNNRATELGDDKPGEANAKSLAESLYRRITSDPALATFFDLADPEALKRKQSDVIRILLGLSGSVDRRRLRAAHARLRLNDSHFDRVIDHLSRVLLDHGVSDPLTQRIVADAESLRDAVLGR